MGEYNYKKNLEKLKERYLNKIKWLEVHMNSENKNNYEGMIEGLTTAIHDIEYMIDEVPMYFYEEDQFTNKYKSEYIYEDDIDISFDRDIDNKKILNTRLTQKSTGLFAMESGEDMLNIYNKLLKELEIKYINALN